MTDKHYLIGTLAVLLAAVVVAALFWPESSTRLRGPEVGVRRDVDAAPAVLESATGGVEDPKADAVQGWVRREPVQVDPSAPDVAAAGRTLVVRGVVRDPDQQPVAKAAIRFGEQKKTTTAADGSYQLTVRTSPDRDSIWLIADGDGFVASAQRIEIDGEKVTADFVLRPAFIVTGRVIDPAGHGIANAQVWTFRKLQRPATTDAEGYFRLADLDPEIQKLYVEASARGFVAVGEMVSVTGERRENLVIVLTPGAIVRGVVYGPGQEPVPGAAVTITTFANKSQHLIDGESDAVGRFEFSGVPQGRHALEVTHGELAAAAQRIDVPAPGGILDVTIELAAGRTLRGIVRAASGGPVAGAVVVAQSTLAEGKGKGRGRALRTATTDDQGRFELAGLPLDELRLSCDAEGFVANRSMVDASVRYREIQLERAARIAGTVVDAWTGEPIQAFTIRLTGTPAEGGKANIGKGLRFNGELFGQWDTGDIPLPAGFTTDVEVSAVGYAVTVADDLVARVDASYDDYRIALSAGVTLSGTVESESGMPLSGATVRLARAGDAAPGGKSGNRHRSRSDAAGRFSFESVPHGDMHILVEGSDQGVFVHETRIPEGVREWQVTIRVTGQGELWGVLLTPGGQPTARADVSLTAVEVPGLGGRTWRTKTDAEGRFVFRSLPFGVYRVARTESVGKRLEMFARYATVTSTTPLEVDLRASGAGTVRGTTIANFAVADDSVVQLIPQYEDDVPTAERSAPRFARTRGGVFTFEGVEPGPYKLRAWGHDGGTDTWHPTPLVDVEVEEAGVTRVELVVEESGR